MIGTDIRSGQFAGADEAASKHCLDAAGSGEPPPTKCTPYRSDTLMLLRAGGGAFRKLSIPRDTLAQIPGQPENKINSAYATGGARLTVRTIEKFLGINVDQVAIIDFDGFRKFIDSIGGVDVNVPTTVCSSVSGGAFNLKLQKGEHTLDGYQAITLARTRENNLITDNGFCQSPPHRSRTSTGSSSSRRSWTGSAAGSPTRSGCLTTSSRGRSSGGTLQRRWSPAWAPGRCPSWCSAR